MTEEDANILAVRRVATGYSRDLIKLRERRCRWRARYEHAVRMLSATMVEAARQQGEADLILVTYQSEIDLLKTRLWKSRERERRTRAILLGLGAFTLLLLVALVARRLA